MDIQHLSSFLTKASLPHALGTSNARTMPDGSTTITFQDGDYSFDDNFFGGQPYGGRAVIHYKQKPVWIMVYYGQVHDTLLKPDTIYDFLRLALQYAPQDSPFRGPNTFRKARLEYRNKASGGMTSYSGKEIILENGKEIYWAKYMGGFVDQEEGVGF